jgi:hypothetical protein
VSVPAFEFGAQGDALLTDYRQRRALEERDRDERKRVDLAEIYSTLNSPGARIRAWEKVHHLFLPASPLHPVLYVIAAATRLSLTEVQDEQSRRAVRASG